MSNKRSPSPSEGMQLNPSEDKCYCKVLTGGQADWNDLEAQPQAMLVSLLKRCAQERDELAVKDEEQAPRLKEMEKDMSRRYLVDPQYGSDRVRSGQYRIAKGITAKWTTAQPSDINADTHGQEAEYYKGVSLNWIKELKHFQLFPASDCNDEQKMRSRVDLSDVISSAMLLYRFCCLFPLYVDTQTPDHFKTVWEAEVWHIRTGRVLHLNDFKGAASAVLSWPAEEDKGLEQDFLDLMSFICGDCPHTYDGCLAGSVA